MIYIVWGWIIVLSLFIFVQNIYFIYFLGSITGILMGGLWTVSRPLLAEMVPLQELGRFFGLYALSGRAAAIFGPIIWGVIVHVFSPERSAGIWLAELLSIPDEGKVRLPYQLAIAALVIIMLIGLYIFRKVPGAGHRVEIIND
jgi:MFS-type transporter involved in bile tolerance (Atg22 family)